MWPDIVIVSAPSGRKSRVKGGLDVWEYVFIARSYDWDVSATAAHLCEPEERVQRALEYYRAQPEDTDRYLNEIDSGPKDVTRFQRGRRVTTG